MSSSSDPSSSAAATTATGSTGESENKRVENIKQYYQQLCVNYRMVTQQLQLPDLPPNRRQVLLSQQERLQRALQDFTERVIKPIMNARNSPRSGANVDRGSSSTPHSTPKRGRVGTTTLLGSAGGPPMVATSMPLLTLPIPSLNVSQYLKAMEYSEGRLVDRDGAVERTKINRTIEADWPSTIPDLLKKFQLGSIKVESEAEDYLLREIDVFLESLLKSICENARHRKRPGITIKDLEAVLSKEFGMATLTAGLPHAVPPPGPSKQPTKKTGQTTNPHHARLQLLKKHGII